MKAALGVYAIERPSDWQQHTSYIGFKMSPGSGTLVIGPSWIGDLVMAQSLFKTLKQIEPDVPIDIVAPAAARPLVERMREVREFIPSPFGHGEFALGRRATLGRELRGRYSKAYVLPGSWKSALVPFVARIPYRCGYVREWRWGILSDARKLPPELKRMTARVYQGLADPTVLKDGSRLLWPSLDVNKQNLDRLLRSHSLAPGAYACFAPGAAFGPAKRWPARHWAELADAYSREGIQAVVLGSDNDRDIADQICSAATSAINLCGRTDLGDVIDLFSQCRIAIANDSGLMHVACAAGARVVALYGSTSPDDTPPLSSNARTVSLELNCSPCHKRHCPLGHHDCLEKLTVDRVSSEARALLQI